MHQDFVQLGPLDAWEAGVPYVFSSATDCDTFCVCQEIQKAKELSVICTILENAPGSGECGKEANSNSPILQLWELRPWEMTSWVQWFRCFFDIEAWQGVLQMSLGACGITH